MFVEKIKFIDFVEGFENGSEIHFGNEQSELLDFYINSVNKISNNEKEVEELSKRLQINCILGQNGAGKTKLLSNIIHFFENEFSDLKHQKEISFSDGSVLTFKVKKDIGLIFDDFFVGSDMFKYSINNKLANDFVNGYGASDFYCEIYNFLQKETHKEIFSNFLNLEKGYEFYLDTFLENKGPDKYLDDLSVLLFYDFLVSFIFGIYNKNYSNISKIFSNTNFNKKIIYLFINKFLGFGLNYKYMSEYKLLHIKFLEIIDKIIIIYKDLINSIEKNDKYKNYDLDALTKIVENILINYYLKNKDIRDFSKYSNEIEYITKIITSISAEFELEFNIDDNFNNYLDQKIFFKNNIFKKLSPQEKQILSLEFFNLDLKFTDSKTTKSFNNLSSGEKIMLMRFVNIYREIYEQYDNGNGKNNFIILIDEPDLHLHLEWQREYIQRLVDVFSTIKQKDITMHFIIATHSPFIISDIPSKNLVKLERYDKNGKQYSKQVEIENNKQTFGANYIDIIRNGFFKNGLLLGGFSREIINNLSLIEKLSLAKDYIDIEKLDENERKIYNKYVKNGISIDNLKEQIGDEFIKNNLVYLNFDNDKNRHG